MKIIKNKHSNRRFVIIAISSLVAVCLIAGGVYAYHLQTQPETQTTIPSSTDDSNVNYNKPTDEQQKAGDDAKKDAINNNNTPTSSDIAISSTNISDSGVLQIRTMITAIDDKGTCTLQMTMGGANDITMTTGTQTLGSYSVCKGFDVPSPQKGTWQIKVTYSGGGKTSTATVQKQVE